MRRSGPSPSGSCSSRRCLTMRTGRLWWMNWTPAFAEASAGQARGLLDKESGLDSAKTSDDGVDQFVLGQTIAIEGYVGILAIERGAFFKKIGKALVGTLGDAARFVISNAFAQGLDTDVEIDANAALAQM